MLGAGSDQNHLQHYTEPPYFGHSPEAVTSVLACAGAQCSFLLQEESR